MLFNSVDFALFFTVVFFIYWFALGSSTRLQNIFLIIASYFSYGLWDWRFLGLIAFSTIVDFTSGLMMSKTNLQSKRKAYLVLSIVVNLGLLVVLKYFNFFIDNFIQVFRLFGAELRLSSLKIILPVGISFYTFQTMSYTIDVYRRKINPTKNFINFAAFVSFFPQLVAGPIERAKDFLPQFSKKRTFKYEEAAIGVKQILWGLLKKMVIADNCAQYADQIFNNWPNENGSTLILGAVFFAFQIYGDFSGYSDIAIGSARLLGFKLIENFRFPYFSRDIAEFWRRWHISLSNWFKDYLYIPLGGSKGSRILQIRNILIIFLVSGFWHGANWTFIMWGLLNALYFIPLLLLNSNRSNVDIVAAQSNLPSLKEFVQIIVTFTLTSIAWIFFRSESLLQAFGILNEIFSPSLFQTINFSKILIFILLIFFLLIEWQGRRNEFAIEHLFKTRSKYLRYSFYYALVIMLFIFSGQEQEFIYFQF